MPTLPPSFIFFDLRASRFLISSSIRFFIYCQPLSTLSTHFSIAITPCMRKSPLCLATNERHFLYIHSSESNQWPRSATRFKLMNA